MREGGEWPSVTCIMDPWTKLKEGRTEVSTGLSIYNTTSSVNNDSVISSFPI